MPGGNYWKYGLFIGAGVIIGAVGATLVSRNPGALRSGMAKVVSHGMDLKEKAQEMAATARENMDDLSAEARHESEKRKAAQA